MVKGYDRTLHERVLKLIHESKMTIRDVASVINIPVGMVEFFVNTKPEEAPMIENDKKWGEFNWQDWCGQLQALQTMNRKASYTQDKLNVTVGDGKNPIAVIFFSDQHMGSWATDYRLLNAITHEIVTTPNLYCALLGDPGQYSIILRNVLEISDNIISPERQTDFIESWFEYIHPKVLFSTWDNHGVERQEKTAGESPLKRVISRRVPWFNGIGHVNLTVGKQLYKGAASHRFRGNSIENPCHAQMRYMRREGVDREWCAGGDTHRPGMIQYQDGEAVRIAINGGSLQLNSGYAKRYFSLFTHPVFPVIEFFPNEHLMVPYWSVGAWQKSVARRTSITEQCEKQLKDTLTALNVSTPNEKTKKERKHVSKGRKRA